MSSRLKCTGKYQSPQSKQQRLILEFFCVYTRERVRIAKGVNSCDKHKEFDHSPLLGCKPDTVFDGALLVKSKVPPNAVAPDRDAKQFENSVSFSSFFYSSEP